MAGLLSTIRGKSLKNLTINAGDYPEWYVDTGNYALNLQVSGKIRGGFRGRMIWQLGGEEATGKTRVWVQAMQRFLRENEERIGIAFLTENDLGSVIELQQEFGDRFIVVPENDIHKVQTTMVKLFNDIEGEDPNSTDTRTMVVLDSWGFLSAAATEEKVVDGKQSMMNLIPTKMKNDLAVSLIYKPLRANSIIFITNHVYIPPEMYSSSVLSGGKKLQYAANGTLVFTKKKAPDKDHRSEKCIIKSELRKGRFPSKENTAIDVPMEYNKGGLTRFGGLFELSVKADAILSPSKGWYEWADKPGEKFRQPKEGLIDFFTNDRLDFIQEKSKAIFCYNNQSDENTGVTTDIPIAKKGIKSAVKLKS
jgi:hypothetical protein